MVIKSKSIIRPGLKKRFFVHICLAVCLPLIVGCMSKIDLKRLIPPASRDDDVMIFDESESMTIAWGTIEGRGAAKFFDDDSYQVGYLRESSGVHYDLILANYPPEKLVGHLVKDVFRSLGFRFGESPYRLEGHLVNFAVDSHNKIFCHIAFELRVVEVKKGGDIIWQEFFEFKSTAPVEEEMLGLRDIHQDVVNQAFEMLEEKLRGEDFLSRTKHQLYLRKHKRKFEPELIGPAGPAGPGPVPSN